MEFDRKKIPSYLMILTIVAVAVFFNVLFFNTHISANDENIVDYDLSDEDINPVRESAVAGLFYPADVYQLDKDLDGYLEHVPSEMNSRPNMIIVPHAGYRYSAQVAAAAYKRLQPFKKQIHRVFLLGPSHRIMVNGVALPEAKSFKTPLGLVQVDTAVADELRKNPLFVTSAAAHKDEHALEVQLPFLQKTLEDFTIIPMLYGQADSQKIADALAPFLQDDTSLLVVSTDLSHYLDYDTAKAVDRRTAEKIQKSERVDPHQSCGATAVNTAILLARQFGLVPKLLDMVNSGDTSGDKERVVGYGAWVYQEPAEEKPLAGIELEQRNLQNFVRHNREALLQIAHTALEKAVREQKIYHPERDEFGNVLFDKGAAFVTLKKNGRLRGCIGSIKATKAIAADIADNAFAAALHDSRFKPVAAEELPEITFSIALLTNFEEIKFTSYTDLLAQIKPNIDGLLLQDGQREGVFLPAVWENLPNKDKFMTELKIKAGLSPTYWSDKVRVFRFRTVEIKDDDN